MNFQIPNTWAIDHYPRTFLSSRPISPIILGVCLPGCTQIHKLHVSKTELNFPKSHPFSSNLSPGIGNTQSCPPQTSKIFQIVSSSYEVYAIPSLHYGELLSCSLWDINSLPIHQGLWLQQTPAIILVYFSLSLAINRKYT